MAEEQPPHRRYGQVIADALDKMTKEIRRESGASVVKVTCEFVLEDGEGKMKLDVRVSPDARTERLDDGKLKPRGAGLQSAADKLAKKFLRKRED